MKSSIRLMWAMSIVVGGLAFLLALPTPVRADPPDDWYVDPAGTDAPGCGALLTPCLTIRYAIGEALTGTTVILSPGVYTQTTTLSLDKPITLTAQNGVGSSVISGDGSVGYVILIESDDVTLSELDVRNGTSDVIRQSDAYTGTVVTGTVVHDCGDECVQLKKCTDCLIANVIVYDAAEDGLNLANSRNSIIRDCEVYGSRSRNGAIFTYGSSGIVIEHNYIHDCTASNGIYVEEMDGEGVTLIQNNLIKGNDFDGQSPSQISGVGILVYKPLVEPAMDARIIIEGNHIEDNTGSDNDAPSGHAVYWIQHADYDWAPIDIRSNQIISNSGDGIHVEVRTAHTGTVTIAKNHILDNAGHGIVLDNAGTLTATMQGNTVISNGTEVDYGGGVYVRGGDDIVLTNNVIATNSLSDTTGLGAGLYVTNTKISLLHTTIAENVGGDGAGLHLGLGSTATLTNTILVSQTVGVTITNGSRAILRGTLWHGNDDQSGGAGIVVSSTSVYSAPVFFGGGDYHLTMESPAIDAGVDAGVETDIDGAVRPMLYGYDLGADEAPNVDEITLTASPNRVTANGLTTTTLTATVRYKDVLQDGAPVVFSSTLGVFANWEPTITVSTTQGMAATQLRSVPSSGAVTPTVSASFGGTFTKTGVSFTASDCQADLTAWTAHDGNPVFDPPGNTIAWSNATGLYDRDRFSEHGVAVPYKIWYSNGGGSIRLITSTNGIDWTNYASATVVSGLTSPDHPVVEYYADGFTGVNTGTNPSNITMHYRIWYWRQGIIYQIDAIRYAESPDGVIWYNDQAITQDVSRSLVDGISAKDWNRGTYGPVDVFHNASGSLDHNDLWTNKFVMYYEGTSGGTEETGLAYSEDAVHWYRYGPDEPVLGRSASGWDSDDSVYGTILRDENGAYHYWYNGSANLAYQGGIGYAVSPDGIHWVKSLDNPIFHFGDGVAWRNQWTYAPFVLYSDTRFDGNGPLAQFKMWFMGKNTSGNEAIGHAMLNPVSLSLVDTSGSGQSGAVGDDLDEPFIVGLRDGCGAPVSGVTVTLAISGAPGGAGSMGLSTLAGTTNAAGHVSTTLTLGDKPGLYTVTAKSTGVTGMPAVFTATATPGPVHHFAFAPIGEQVETRFFTIIITAEDGFSNVVTDYTGPAMLTDSTGTISPTLSDYFVDGVLTQTVAINNAQASAVITATHTTTPTIHGASDAFDVLPLRVTNLDTGERFLTIQEAIDDGDTNTGHTISATVGVYTENVTLNKRVSIIGAGSGSDPSNNTILRQDSDTSLVRLTASGLTTDVILLQNLRIEPDGIYGIEIPSGGDVAHLTLDDVKIVGADPHAGESEVGLKVATDASLTHLTVTDSGFDNCDYGWYFAKHGDWGPGGSNVRYVTVIHTTFNDNDYKGLYVEKLSNATFESCTVDHNGRTDFWNQAWNGGFDVNLKGEETYQNLTFRDMTVTNNGLGYKEGAGLMIKARDDGATYGAHPATLMTVTIEGGTFTGNERGIRLGEPGKGNATPGNVQIHHAVLTGNVQTYAGTDGSEYGDVVNHTQSPVDATRNDWGVTDLAAIEEKIYHQADDPALDEVLYYEVTLNNDGSSPMADGVSSATVTATLTGLLQPGGHAISLTTDLGTLSAVTATTDANGMVTIVITSTTGGTATITGTAGMTGDNPKHDTIQVTFVPLTLDHFYFYLMQDQIAGEGFPVAISARDAAGVTLTGFNGFATLTDTTHTLLSPSPIQFHNGVWNGVLTVTRAYAGDVLTATYTRDANRTGASHSFYVAHNTAITMALSPATESTVSGERVTYTVVATDAYGNSWDATDNVAYAIESGAGGSWAGHIYTAQYSGTWTVVATFHGVTDTASLSVERGSATGVALSPAIYTVTAGDPVTYTVAANDDHGNTWDVTPVATYTISPGAGGAWAGHTYASQFIGSWTVTATVDDLTGTATLHVITATVAEVSLSPSTTAVIAGQSLAYTVIATDTSGNRWDATAGTHFVIDSGARGAWAGPVYTSEVAGVWTVTAVYGGASDAGLLTITPATATSIQLSPPLHTVTAGDPVTYTVWATDAYGNDWEATGEGSYAIQAEAGGYWEENVYISEFAGTWAVTTTLDGLADSATLVVQPGAAATVTLSPAVALVQADQIVTYTVRATDTHGNGWDATTRATFAIEEGAGGTWDGNAYTSQFAGTWIVTATVDGVPGTASLTVGQQEPSTLVQFSHADYRVEETAGAATITVTLASASSEPVTVTYATQDSTAMAGADYTARTGTVRFDVGQTSRRFTVPIFGDAIAEGHETVNLILSAPVHAALGTPSQAVLTIVDNVIHLPLVMRGYGP